MEKSVPSKHIKTLNRRLTYLEALDAYGDANSYDLSEIGALRHVIRYIQGIKDIEEQGEINLVKVGLSLVSGETL